MIWRERRPASGHRFAQSGPMKCDHIEIALGHNRATVTTHRLKGQIQTIQSTTFLIDRAFAGVEILGLLVGLHGPRPKGHHSTANISDREGHTPSQPVIVPPGIPLHEEPRGRRHLSIHTGVLEMTRQGVPAIRRKPKTKMFDRLGIQATLIKILTSGFPGRLRKLLPVTALRLFDRLIEGFAFAPIFPTTPRFGDFDSKLSSQTSDSLRKGQVLKLDQKRDRIPTLLATKAVENAAVWADVE